MSCKPILHDEAAIASAPMLMDSAAASPSATSDAQLKQILADVLGISEEDAAALTHDSGLFGHLPELDSMAVAGLLTEIEDRFGIVIDDDEVDGEMLESFGGLLDFVDAKLAQG